MERILGHERAITTLRRALRCGRFHHAWIFSGPKGVGKFTTALEVARILVDPSDRMATGADAETHPDVHVIRKELARFCDDATVRTQKLSNIPVAVLREYMIGGRTKTGRALEAPAYRKASHGHGKVFIIDEAELIDPYDGQPALLKTLEEPPPETYIILVTTRPGRLWSTIRSRCQHVRFGPLPPDAFAAWMDRADLGVDDEERAMITELAGGAPGVATLAATYGFASWRRTLDPLLAEIEAGSFPPRLGAAMADLVETFAAEWVKRNRERNPSKDAANKDGARHLLTMLAARARRDLAAGVDDARDPAPRLTVIDLIHEAERHLASNVNMKHVFENLAVQWGRACAPAAV